MKPAIGIAYNVMKKNRMKMAKGGDVKAPPSPAEEAEGPDGYCNGGQAMAKGGMIKNIMKKRLMAKGGMVASDDDEMSGDSDTMPEYEMGDDQFTADANDDMPNMTYPDPDGVEGTEGMDEDTEGKKAIRGMLVGIMKGKK